MKKVHVRLVLASGIYGLFMVVFLLLRNGIPGGVAPAVIASVIYISLVSVFLRRQTT